MLVVVLTTTHCLKTVVFPTIKIWTATTDHNGKFSVGDFFSVDQRTGFINFSAGSYAFDVVTDPTPELGGQLDALTNKIVNLGTPTAAADAATKAYVDSVSGSTNEIIDSNTVLSVDGTANKATFVAGSGLGTAYTFDNNSIVLERGRSLKLVNGTTSNNNSVTVDVPFGVTTSYTLTLPGADGTNGQSLVTDGSGNLSFSTVTGIIVADGGNFDNGTSLVSTSTTYDGGSFD
jgi:hypothetical protein